MEDREKLYMVLDDTVDIGNEPFVPKTNEDEAFLQWAVSLKDKYMKQ